MLRSSVARHRGRGPRRSTIDPAGPGSHPARAPGRRNRGGAARARQVRRLAAQRHRHRCTGRARSGAARRRGGATSSARRPSSASRPTAAPGSRRRRQSPWLGLVFALRAHRHRGAGDRPADAATRRTLPLAVDNRLGLLDRDAVRQRRWARAAHRRRTSRRCRSAAVVLDVPDPLPDLGAARAASCSARTCCSRAGGDPRLRGGATLLASAARTHSGSGSSCSDAALLAARPLALCPHEPLRQPVAVPDGRRASVC